MKYSKTTFVFSPEMGARLRTLRRRRSLSLRELASLMERSRPGSLNPLARLEQGKVKYPSINLVADFLRACGAGFEDLLDLLKSYTSQAPVPRLKADAAVAEALKALPRPERRAMLKWEKAMTEVREQRAEAAPEKKKPRVETDRQRIFRIIWSFIHANWNEAFEEKLYVAMLKLKGVVPKSERKHACNHARRFFGILTRYYRHEKKRERALERVRKQAGHDGFSDSVVTTLLAAATEAHHELAVSGRLDWQPTQDEVIKARGYAPRVLKAEARLDMDEASPVTEYNKALSFIRTMAFLAVNERLDELKLDHYYVKRHYFDWIDRLIPIADAQGTESPEWRAEVEDFTPRMPDHPLTHEVAGIVAATFDRMQPKLPPKPDKP